MDILIPRHVDDRFERLKQNNLRTLQQQTISCDGLIIDKSWDFYAEQSKVRLLDCKIFILMGYMPEWLKKCEVTKSVMFTHQHAYSLKNSPHTVRENFDCSNNSLINLIGAPKYVGGYFNAECNDLISLEGLPTHIEKGLRVNNNRRHFVPKDVPKDCYIGFMPFKN